MKWICMLLILVSNKLLFAQEAECSLSDAAFVEKFFNNCPQWAGKTASGTISALIDFKEPQNSSFHVDDKTAPISSLSLSSCEKIKFKIEYNGALYHGNLIKKETEIIVKVGVPPLYYQYTLEGRDILDLESMAGQ